MPKRVGYLYEKMCDKALIRLAIREGSKGKKKRWDVKLVLKDPEKYVDEIHRLLVTERYIPTTPRKKRIYDKSCCKWRDIKIVPFFPDGIMHQLCVMAMKDVLMRGMYTWSCASIPGRGNSWAAKYVKRSLKNDPKGTKHCCKMDIKGYYPSINRKKVIWMLSRKVKDKRFLKLVYSVINSDPDGGLSIGFYINQWLANYYLEKLDHFILTLPGVKYYVRNMDDMVLLGPNKKKLHKARKMIDGYLGSKLDLKLKGNWQVFPVDKRGIDFVGFRFYHTHTALRRRNFLKFRRNCSRAKKQLENDEGITFRMASGLLARAGQLKHCNCLKAKQKYYDLIDEKVLKHIVRMEGRRNTGNRRGVLYHPTTRKEIQRCF